jgi:polyisoprenoid-binding protein YceI
MNCPRPRLSLAAVLTVMLVAPFAAAQSRTYTIVAAESKFWVAVSKAGLLSALSHDHEIGVKEFGGKVTVPQAGAADGSLTLDIESKSLGVLDRKPSESDKKKIFETMHNEVLESTRYDKISFRSVSVTDLKPSGDHAYNLILHGDLTLHGITKRIDIPLALTISPERLLATGKYALKLSDYGVRAPSAGGGTVKVKNEVIVNFEILAKAS